MDPASNNESASISSPPQIPVDSLTPPRIDPNFSSENVDLESLSHAARNDYLWRVHGYLNEYIRFGDAKAGFIGAFASGLLAFLYSSELHSQVFGVPVRDWSIQAWLALFSFTALAVSAVLTLLTVRPRLRSSQSSGFVFWGNIAAHKDLSNFRKGFNNQTQETLNDELLQHLFDLSKHVCIPKYRNISLSVAALGIGCTLAVASLAIQGERAPKPNTSQSLIHNTSLSQSGVAQK